jgi:formylglycine-generating enzyme required for sulfatase activity
MTHSAGTQELNTTTGANWRLNGTEVVLLLAVGLLLVSLAWPWVLSARERARQVACGRNLNRLSAALSNYQATHGWLPPAGLWRDDDGVFAYHKSPEFDRFARAGWMALVLPFTPDAAAARGVELDLLVVDQDLRSFRERPLAGNSCPSDPFNRDDNRFELQFAPDRVVAFARGNYALNGGSHCFKTGPGNTAFLTGDAATLEFDPPRGIFRYSGNGVAGFNVAFRSRDFTNSASTLILLDEVRAGIDPLDPRGVWALAQIAGSVTWSHGVNGDDDRPNADAPHADDILNCLSIQSRFGRDELMRLGMPCVDYVDFNSQATARSLHPGGVQAALLDQSVRFYSQQIDPGLWHALHSRETPPNLLAADAHSPDPRNAAPRPAASTTRPATSATDPGAARFENSLGMAFVRVPAGEFLMGRPDQGNDYDLPPEVPPHLVRISRPYYLGACEVTRRQFAAVTSETSGDQAPDAAASPRGEFPAAGMTWQAAADFCLRLSQREAERTAGRRYRLPTEAEWEYACRAGSIAPFQWRRHRRLHDATGEAAGIEPPLPLSPVASFPANAYGLFDMRGNVWEWCQDWFARDYYSRSPVADPPGPEHGYIKVVRGSDWTFVGEVCKLNYAMLPPWKSSPYVGFRVVCETAVPAESVVSEEHAEERSHGRP